MDFVSVIMPAYNAEKSIEKAIQSVLAQTHVNLELIIIDDGSTDKTAKIIERYAREEPRIKFYQNKKNIGVAETRNRGIELAVGELIAFIDSDDAWRKRKLELQISILNRGGGDIVYTSYAMIDGVTGKKKRDYIVPVKTDYNRMLFENVIGCSTVLLKKECLTNRHFSGDYAHEDYIMWLELLRNGSKAVGCSDVLVDYQVFETSRSFNKWKASNERWRIFRKQQGLPIYKSICVFCVYAVRGMRKHFI